MTIMLMVLSMLVVGIITQQVVSEKVRKDAASSQANSLRVASFILGADKEGIVVRSDKGGNVSSVHASRFPTFENHEMIDQIGLLTGETATVFAWDAETRDFWRKTTNIIKPDGQRAVGTPLGQTGAVYPVVTKGKTFRGEANILGKTYYTVYQPILNDAGDVSGILYVGVEKARINAVIGDLMMKFLISVIPVLATALIVSLFAIRMLLKPVRELASVTEALANEDLSTGVPYTDRTDEIGLLANSVAVLKSRAGERRELATRQKQTEEKAIERQGNIEKMVQDFRGTVRDLLVSVNDTAKGLDTTASDLDQIARENSGRASDTMSASEEASRNVQSVASAAEELSSSIGEISRQVAQTSEVVGRATENSRMTNEKVQSLAASATKIGEVVSLIQAIAEQTNLLALNATIEAARAGESGKGFAVVASEVKQLASQTSRATDEIAQQISAIQSATGDSVQAIADIASTINEVNAYTSSIASAVQQQGVATSEISGSVQRAAQGTGMVTSTMSSLSMSVNRTSQSAQSVLASAGSLSEKAEALTNAVDTFLSEVAAA